MQRWCNKIRSLTTKTTPFSISSSYRLIHSFNNTPPTNNIPLFNTNYNNIKNGAALGSIFTRPLLTPNPISFIQLRHLTKKEMKEKMLKYKPKTPTTSKLKKYKIKCYSSFKGRFRLMKDGQIRRWKEGKRHNAHLKSKSAKRRGRRPGIVPAAYAKVMKKLNFCG